VSAARRRRVHSYAALGAALLALPGAGCSLEDAAPTGEPPGGRGSDQPVAGAVVSVTDGDTLRVKIGQREVAVRLIGIDAPETRNPDTPVQCGGPEATAHLEQLVAPGDRVTLRGDRSQDREDRYGRLLAYVTPQGESQLNRGQVAAGWARVYVYDERPFDQLESLRAAEQGARRAARGVWARCGGNFPSSTPARSSLAVATPAPSSSRRD
jgi:micrococcal nuclease